MNSIAEALRQSKTIAVVGLSPKKIRPSFGVSEYMQRVGYRIIPVNPAEAGSEILGEKCYARLEDIPEPVDIVDVFRRSEFVPDIVDSAIGIRAKCIWLQEEVQHDKAAEKARSAGLYVVQDRCILKEHRRLV